MSAEGAAQGQRHVNRNEIVSNNYAVPRLRRSVSYSTCSRPYEAVQRLVLMSFSARFHNICASVRTALQSRPTEMYLK